MRGFISGFISLLQAALWDAQYDELAAFHEKHAHCNVAATYAPALSGWVARQRRAYRAGSLSAERQAALLTLDFEFDPLRAAWEAKLSEYAVALQSEAPPAPDTTWASDATCRAVP